MTPRLPAGTALLLALLVADTAAQNSRPVRPKGAQTTVEVVRGGSVRIALQGHERNLNRLEYRPLGAPRYGRLSRVEQYNGPERQGPGYVTYTHGNDEESTTDTFAFEVRAPLTKMTGRGRVIIRIIDAPARLEITPSTLDFGAAATGDPPVFRTVELANTGGGVIQGFLDVPEPFALADDGMFVLRRGEKTRIPVTFAPDRAGPYLFPVQPVPGDPSVLTLKGEALSPFSVEVDDARFALNSNGSRSARAVVRNASQQMQTISVVLPPGSPVEVEATEPLDLAPGQETAVTLGIPPEEKAAIRPFDVRFEAAGHAQVQRFEAAAVPATLVVVAGPDFGEVRPGTAAQANLVLRNDGGAPAEARLQEHASITPANGATAITVAPGEELVVPLKLRLKPDQDFPENFLVAFRGRDIPVAVKASLVAVASSTPSPRPTPATTPPPVALLALNQDIKLERKQSAAFVSCRELQGWTNFIQQHRDGGTGPWQDYQLPAPHEGLLGWITGLARRIQERLDTPIDRTKIEGVDLEDKFTRFEISPDKIDGPDIWRVLATPPDGSSPRPVSEDFQIKADRLVSALKETAAPGPAKAAVPEATTGQPGMRIVGPETPMASAAIKADRHSALLQVAFATGLRVQGFRLERGAMVARIDPKSLIPQAPEFRKIDPPEAEVEVLGLGEGEAEGEKFTVGVARIAGLPAGTRTYWRVVPTGPNGDLAPTAVLLVDTEAPPPFPWNTVLLVGLFALLAGVLYLRWKINRIPG